MNNGFLRNKRCLLLIIFVACCSGIYSQSVLTYDASSPEVGSLLRVQDSSVNLYTGRPHISVPLYSLALKDFTYDIELLYNAEGNKPDMPVSNVGLGWSVTGGQIHRVANGVWDEVYTFTQYLDRTEKQDWNLESNLRGYYDDIDDGTDENFWKEPDLDEFIINIGRINASFYMYRDREGKIVTKIASQSSPHFEVKDVKIGSFPEIPFAEDELYVHWMDRTSYPKISIVPRPVLFKEITIVDSDGVTYIFGGDVNSIDFSCEYYQDPRYEQDYDGYGNTKEYWGQSWENYHSCLYAISSAWHIKKIILPNEEESIDFHYSKGYVNIIERVDLHQSLAFGMYGPVTSNTVSFIELPQDIDPEFHLLRDKTYSIVYPSLLTGIYASNGNFVEFTSSKRNDLRTDGRYKRKPLFLKDNYGGLMAEIANNKCYSFKLDKMETGTGRTVDFYYTDKNDRRLTLDSLKIDQDDIYRFQYNPQLLPKYGTTLTDNWGYYNGKDYYPRRWSLNFDNLYAIRQPDFAYAKAEILEKIIYPTGGEVLFQYELHDYAKIATQYPFDVKEESGVAGGVRIKKMIYSDNENPLVTKTKEFLYLNEDGSSSGILSVVPRYAVSGRDYYTNSNTQVNWVDQFHMGYSRVTELLPDSSRTVYSFINHDQVKDEPSVGAYTHGVSDFLHNRYTSRKLDRGLLHSTRYYDADSNLLKQEVFEYHSELSNYLRTINQYYFIGGYPRRVSANKIYTYFPFLQKKVTTLYIGCDSINETEEYEYNRYRLLTCTKKYTNNPNDNSTLETNTTYLPELMEEYNRMASGTAIPANSPLKVYDTMRLKGMLNYPIETVTKRNRKVVSAEVMTYRLSDRFVVPNKQYKLETAVPLDDYSPFKLISTTQYSIDERCMTETEYLDFDSHCNPTNIVDKTNVNTAYLWGYNGLYPTAKVVNARNTFKSVPYNSGSDDYFYENFESYSTSSPFGYHSKGCYTGAYTISMVTNPERGYFIDYQVFKDGKWNYMKRDFINSNATIDEGICPIDNVRVYPKDASITTYDYFPLIGLRSETNERGLSKSYQYDSFGKLTAIMDNDMNIIKKYDYSYQGQSPKPVYHYK